MTPKHDLGVVIVTYRSANEIVACLDAVGSERSALNLHVVVVDNDSGDGTLELVRERFPWVTALQQGWNSGFSRACNRGLRELSSRHVLLLNPDCVPEKGTLPSVVRALDARPEVGVLGCKVVREDGALDPACKREIPDLPSAAGRLFGLRRLFPQIPALGRYHSGSVGDDDEGEVGSVTGAFLLARAAAVAEVGGLDERYWMYGEDLDWCVRFRDAGWGVRYWPGARAVHRKFASSGEARTWPVNLAFHTAMWVFYRDHKASRHPAALRAAVWTAIHVRLLISAAASGRARRLAG